MTDFSFAGQFELVRSGADFSFAPLTRDANATIQGAFPPLTVAAGVASAVLGSASAAFYPLRARVRVEALQPGEEALRFAFEQTAPSSTDLLFDRAGGDVPPVSAAIQVAFPGLTAQLRAVAPTVGRLTGTFPLLAASVQVRPLLLADVQGLFPTLTAEVRAVLGVEATLTGQLPGLSANVLVTPAVDAAVAGQLPGLSARVEAVVSEAIRIRADFPLPSAVAEASYASHTDRPTVGQSAGGWQTARTTEYGVTSDHQTVAAFPVGSTNGWQAGRDLRGSVEHRLPSTLVAAPMRQSVKFQDAQSIHVPRDSAHQEANRTRQSSRTGFQDGARVLDSKLFKHQDGDRAKRNMARTGWQDAALRGSEYDTSFQRALAFIWQRRGRFQDARQPLVGISVPPKEVVPPPPYYEPTVDLVFGKVAKVDSFIPFRFVPEDDTSANTTTVPVQRVYIVLNNTALRRLSDNAVVPCTSMSLSLDVTSWTWGFDASIPGNYQALVEPTSDGPVALAAWVNGTEFRVLAESISRERSFGKVGLRVSGRGINAELDAPYAPIQTFRNTELRTSAQLLEDVLTVNGVPMGYAFDYAPAAWEVPAGAFNHQGTYIGALAAIAQASGGFLLPHTRDRAFAVRQLYPTAPWEWGSAVPDFVLPSAVVTKEGVQWKEMPSYNRVFVSGQDSGVLGQVTRAGTDGTVLAPMVVDALITSATAARQRGLSVLGNTGRQLMHSLRLPVLAETGVIQPGALVQYEDGDDVRVGMVRSTSVEVGYPDVYQTIGVECHA